MTLRIANGAGFLGDQLDAPRRLVEAAEVDFLTLEYLAELTLSILARQRRKDPQAGFARDLLPVMQSICPALAAQDQLGVVTNGGGVNPQACANAVGALLAENGLGDLRIAVVEGDNITNTLDALQRAGHALQNMETGQPLADLGREIVTANVYLGAAPIADALADGARVVITGRVADAALTLGPAVHRLGWSWNDYNPLAGGSVAGHLIECGAQVTGGFATDWQGIDLARVGYPIAEIEADGSCVITKPANSGGTVNRRTVVEQLVYEIGDPQNYLTPDVAVDFTTLAVEDLGGDRVRVTNATGRAAPETLKVSVVYENGFTASGQLLVFGPDCIDKAQACAEILFERLRGAGCEFDETNVELLGRGDGVPLANGAAGGRELNEVVLRVAVRDARYDAVERFTKEIAPLITSGPAGLAGYATGRSRVLPVLSHWPALLPRELVTPSVEVRSARQW